MTPQTRATANLTALAELLKPDPDPDVLAHYEGWADARVRNQVPPRLEPPPLTPEQIKAQEKRARKAAKQAMQNQTVNSDSRAVAKLVNAGYPGGLRCPKQR